MCVLDVNIYFSSKVQEAVPLHSSLMTKNTLMDLKEAFYVKDRAGHSLMEMAFCGPFPGPQVLAYDSKFKHLIHVFPSL